MADQETRRIPTGTNVFEVIARSDKLPWEDFPERHKNLPVEGWKKLPGVEWYYNVREIQEQGAEKKDLRELIVLVSREGKWLGQSVRASVSELKPEQILLIGLLTEIGLELQDRQNFERTLQARYKDITTMFNSPQKSESSEEDRI